MEMGDLGETKTLENIPDSFQGKWFGRLDETGDEITIEISGNDISWLGNIVDYHFLVYTCKGVVAYSMALPPLEGSVSALDRFYPHLLDLAPDGAGLIAYHPQFQYFLAKA